MHIDTDEFLVPNPWIASYVYNASNANKSRRDELEAILPEKPTDGSLWSLFSKFMEGTSNTGCVMMPRILFGSREDKEDVKTTTATAIYNNQSNNDSQTTKYTWNHPNFESLRWQYHSDFESNARPKSMVNVQAFSDRAPIFETKLAKSIHRPMISGRPGCPGEPLRINNPKKDKQPLAVYHYLGSLKRYMARKDARRDPSIYKRSNEKSNFAKGDENIDIRNATTTTNTRTTRWWMGEWLEDFVETHGPETAYAVLGEQYGTRE